MHKIIMLLAFIVSFSFSPMTYAASDAKDEEGGAKRMEYVKLSPLMIPVIDEDGLYQMLSLVIVIEVDGLSDADKVKAKKPRLQDAYIQDMYGIMNEHAALKNGVVQVNIVKKHLNAITDKVMGDEIETEVLLQVVQQLPM